MTNKIEIEFNQQSNYEGSRIFSSVADLLGLSVDLVSGSAVVSPWTVRSRFPPKNPSQPYWEEENLAHPPTKVRHAENKQKKWCKSAADEQLRRLGFHCQSAMNFQVNQKKVKEAARLSARLASRLKWFDTIHVGGRHARLSSKKFTSEPLFPYDSSGIFLMETDYSTAIERPENLLRDRKFLENLRPIITAQFPLKSLAIPIHRSDEYF